MIYYLLTWNYTIWQAFPLAFQILRRIFVAENRSLFLSRGHKAFSLRNKSISSNDILNIVLSETNLYEYLAQKNYPVLHYDGLCAVCKCTKHCKWKSFRRAPPGCRCCNRHAVCPTWQHSYRDNTHRQQRNVLVPIAEREIHFMRKNVGLQRD